MTVHIPPLCTVMIPTYCQAQYIRRTIESVLAQDYPNIEIVVSDDNSGDDTASILSSYDDPRLRWHKNPVNLGRVGNYRSLLYEHARGKYVINLDGDDYFIDETFVSRAVAVLEASDNAVIAFADRYELASDETLPGNGVLARDAKTELFNGVDYLLSWPRKNARIHHLTAVYNRSLAIKTGFYSRDIISSDYESLFRLLLRGDIIHIRAKVAVWRHHDMNASVTRSDRQYLQDIELYRDVAKTAAAEYPRLASRFARWSRKNLARKYYTRLLSRYRDDDQPITVFDKEFEKLFPGIRGRVMRSPVTWIKIASKLLNRRLHSD